YALGAGGALVAVTHDDDYPPAVRTLPRITRTTIPAGASAREIDVHVREAGARGESTFHLDSDALREARPDVILGQTLCAVCAVTLDRLPRGLEREPVIVRLSASTIEGMFEDLRQVGAARCARGRSARSGRWRASARRGRSGVLQPARSAPGRRRGASRVPLSPRRRRRRPGCGGGSRLGLRGVGDLREVIGQGDLERYWREGALNGEHGALARALLDI